MSGGRGAGLCWLVYSIVEVGIGGDKCADFGEV
jgi:hypothetical protein